MERFNRDYNDAINTDSPSMCHFVQTINKLSNDKVDEMKYIEKMKSKRPTHQKPSFMKIPFDYDTFKVPGGVR